MNYEQIKEEFIKLKKEELECIVKVIKSSHSKTLSDSEKLEIYRNIKNYKIKLNEVLKKLCKEVIKNGLIDSLELEDVIIEFDIDKSYLSMMNNFESEKLKFILKSLWIEPETFKFKLSIEDLLYRNYYSINPDMIQNGQRLIEMPIYFFCGHYDYRKDCYGPALGGDDDYIYGVYEEYENRIYTHSSTRKEISKKSMDEFESDKIIIASKRYVYSEEVKKIFEEELLNDQNKTIDDCVKITRNRIEELNYVRSPEYKEKVLLDKINELYKSVKGEFIKKEVLYSGNFLDIIREIYKLPNKKTVEKEKVVKNSGKNSVIVIAVNSDSEYIITFQNRIKDKIIAEFPSGYIEENETPIEAARRELQEETGYTANDLFIIDDAYTSPGIDNSTTYIVVANNCIKTNDIKTEGTELVNYGLFSRDELKYLIDNNIISGALNKLAYYSLIRHAVWDFTYINGNKKVYKLESKNKSN